MGVDITKLFIDPYIIKKFQPSKMAGFREENTKGGITIICKVSYKINEKNFFKNIYSA